MEMEEPIDMMNKPLRNIALSFALLAFLGCESTTVVHEHPAPPPGPPAHAPAHGYRAKHTYNYYPASQVYYEKARDTWWYLKSGKWEIGTSLPSTVILKGDPVLIEMESDSPYKLNKEHKKQYAPGFSRKPKAQDKFKGKGTYEK